MLIPFIYDFPKGFHLWLFEDYCMYMTKGAIMKLSEKLMTTKLPKSDANVRYACAEEMFQERNLREIMADIAVIELNARYRIHAYQADLIKILASR